MSDEWHYVMTVAGFTPRGECRTYSAGTITPDPGVTREDAFFEAYRETCERWHQSHGAGVDPIVTFWSLEPNDLEG